MRNKTVRSIASLLMVAALLLVSCGPRPAAPTPTTTPAPGAAVPTTPATPVTPVPVPDTANMISVTLKKLDGTTMKKQVEKPQYGGTLNLRGALSTFGIANMSTSVIANLYADTLLHGDWARGKAGTGEFSWHIYEYITMDQFMPALAESWEMPDDETIIYHIRKGVHWALDDREASKLVGGRELTANDVVWNLKYQFLTVPATSLKRTYGGVVEKAEVRATDKYTVVVKAPKLDLFQFLGYISDVLPILPPEVVEKYGKFAEWDKLVTTGAFIIKDHVPDSVTSFVKNPSYWGFDPVLGKDFPLPYVDAVKYFHFTDQSLVQASFKTGKIDALVGGTPGRMNKDQWDVLLKNAPHMKAKKVDFGTSGMRIGMQMNDPKAPWQDIRVRRALMLAINHQEIIDTYYEGEADLQAFPIPNAPELFAMGWAIPTKDLPREVQELFEYHPEKAKALLAEAGYPSGFKTSLMINATAPEWLDIGAVLKGYWAKIGIEMELDIKDAGVFSGIANDAKQCCMVPSNTWGASALYNTFRPPPYPSNQGNINDPRMIELRAKMFEVFWDPQKRNPIMTELYKYTMTQMWYLPLPSGWAYRPYQPWLKNYDAEPSISYWGQAWQFVWIDRDLKRSLGY